MIKQLFNFTLDDSYTGTSKLVWTLPKSMLTIPSELQEANKYKFNYNGTDYTCTKVSEGDTKYFFTYTPDGSTVSAIEIQYFKNEDKLELSVRTNLIDFAVGNVVKLLEEVDEPTPPTPGDDELIDDTYEIKLRSTTTFNRYAIVDTEVTMKKPDDKAVNYVADEAVVKVNGVEVSGGGGGYPEPTGTIEITENGTANVKDYAEANVNVPTYPEPAGTITITENGTVNVKDYAEADVNVSGSAGDGFVEVFNVNNLVYSAGNNYYFSNTSGTAFENILSTYDENNEFLFVAFGKGGLLSAGGCNGYISEMTVDDMDVTAIVFETSEGYYAYIYNYNNSLYVTMTPNIELDASAGEYVKLFLYVK